MKDTTNVNSPDLATEQEELLALMERSITPRLMKSIQDAYRPSIMESHEALVETSYEGTVYA